MFVVKATLQSWFCPRVNFVILSFHLLPWASISPLKSGILPFRVVGGTNEEMESSLKLLSYQHYLNIPLSRGCGGAGL